MPRIPLDGAGDGAADADLAAATAADTAAAVSLKGDCVLAAEALACRPKVDCIVI